MIEIVLKAEAKVGSLTKLGEALGITRNAFYRWRQVPANRVLALERLTGISRHEMRPDIYPIEDPKPRRKK